MKLSRFSRAFLVLLLLSVLLGPAHVYAGAADYAIPGGHFYTQTAGQAALQGYGYAITDDSDARFWSEFKRLGGVDVLGYPASNRFIWNGFVCQATQRVVMQWRPEVGQVYFVNVIDLMTQAGLDPWLATMRQTPRPADFGPSEAGLSFGQIVAKRQALLNDYPLIKARYFASPDPLNHFGLPTAPIQDMGPAYVLRAQRVIIQQWKDDYPWARKGDVTVALGGDIAKEAGLLAGVDPNSVIPRPAPGSQASQAGASKAGLPLVNATLQVPSSMASGVWATPRVMSLPSGFEMSLFSDGVEGARLMAFSPEGDLWVTQKDPGRISILPDKNHDGIADMVVVFAEGLNFPHGIAFRPGYVYIAEMTRVIRFPYSGMQVLGPPEVVIPDLPGGGEHTTRTIGFGPDGKLYVSVGSSCNVCEEQDPRRAVILQYNPDGSGGRVYARGLRNAVGFTWNPTTNEMWSTNNGRDFLGDNLPPEMLFIIKDGAHYGWPYCYGLNPDPQFGRPAFCANDVEPPAVEMQAHSAPLGLRFNDKQQFPAQYQGDLFVAFHGSWNRSFPTGYKIVRVPVVDGKPSGAPEDFITGWLNSTGKSWGRPVDVLFANDGTLFISDDLNGVIYRVTYKGS